MRLGLQANMKDRLLIFTQTGARLEKDPLVIEKYKGHPNTVLNPDLSKVVGLSPHFWKLDDGQVLPVPVEDRKARLAEVAKHGGPTAVKEQPKPRTWKQGIPENVLELIRGARVEMRTLRFRVFDLEQTLAKGRVERVKLNRMILFSAAALTGLACVYAYLHGGIK